LVILRSKVFKSLAFKFKVRIFLIFWLKVRTCLHPKVRIYLGPKIKNNNNNNIIIIIIILA
jgi:hypothetical protein